MRHIAILFVALALLCLVGSSESRHTRRHRRAEAKGLYYQYQDHSERVSANSDAFTQTTTEWWQESRRVSGDEEQPGSTQDTFSQQPEASLASGGVVMDEAHWQSTPGGYSADPETASDNVSPFYLS